MNQLAVSTKLSEAQMERAMKLCGDMEIRPNTTMFQGLNSIESSEFLDYVLTSIANSTINIATLRPELSQPYKTAGFEVIWNLLKLE